MDGIFRKMYPTQFGALQMIKPARLGSRRGSLFQWQRCGLHITSLPNVLLQRVEEDGIWSAMHCGVGYQIAVHWFRWRGPLQSSMRLCG